ncbi:IPT/TIG domain protein [Luteitalea pratensis]|uniref:IPT/TIG domain protein n=1 Tax=Luteitalea pratensis TaxID=1855912 RepID=A0A143PP34_LUTPR|nr:GDSL-type esterase/lipase family protein [Luteitalea pratensis]AMY09923.1 IPT/TIG domain protein [Luteitalea pratensis]
MLSRIALTLLLCGSAVTPAFAQGASTWFLAEGASNGTFDEDILVGNPSASTLSVTVRLLPAPDALITPPGTVLEKVFTLPATGRLTVNIRREFPALNGATSAQVSAVVKDTSTPADIVVERSMFFPLTGTPYAGGTGASGVTAPAKRWILAEGAAGVFETFILIANPSAARAAVTVRYLKGDGASVAESTTIEPGNRATLWPSANPALAGQGFSTVVESDQPVVAERAMYFDNFRSGHDALGVTSGRTTWYFAEGFTGGNATIAFETFLLIGNDNPQPASVTATFFRDSGAPLSRTYMVPAQSRFNIWTDQERDASGALLLPGTAFSVRLNSSVPIVAERSVYWGTPSAADPTTPTFPWKEGHVVAGVEQPVAKWAFAEGRQGDDGSGGRYDSFFLVVNPSAVDIDVRATFATEDGTGVTTMVRVPANTRANIWPAAGLTPDFDLLQGRRFAAFLESVGGQPFVAERAMYWNEFNGGHANAGTPWSGTFSTPAQAPVDVQVASMTPTSGRLTGGTSVTIRGQNFGPAPEVRFGGQIVPVTVSPDRTELSWTVPVRNVTTGYGSAGPTEVTVRSQSRFLRAPNFTRYFTVLTFGDSLTWGQVTSYIPGTSMKVSGQASRPYPRQLKMLLSQNPQFGPYALITNAGWPGEFVTVAGGGGNTNPGGVARSARCTAGQPNCFAPTGADPTDYFTPFDVALFLEGINDLNANIAPGFVTAGMKSMVVDAKATSAQVVLELFQSYGKDIFGTESTDPAKVTDYNRRLEGLAAEQQVFRERYAGISMGPDGLHPSQAGYDAMATIAYDKLRDIFRRCGTTGACP